MVIFEQNIAIFLIIWRQRHQKLNKEREFT